ncbi:MAG: diphosphate--fructose-6-phosphate 1-phosphotransferase [Bacilli bacterium]|nr:diphosphate--fructose-6-phosphate 1-phosphotransferase [Bacilli bacterium]
MAKNLVYLQSGGPTSVINTSLYGAMCEAAKHEEIGIFYGAHHGVEGLLNDDLIDLARYSPKQLALLKQTPGAFLGSSRKKVSGDPEALSKVKQTLLARDIGYVLVNGGNDSMDTCLALSSYLEGTGIRVVGVPKTIDNDLFGTDHCVGFPSACKHIMNTVASIAIDASSYKKGKVTIVEVMGRDAGWLAASASLLKGKAKPDMVLLPELKLDLRRFYRDLQRIYAKKGFAIIVVSEGLDFPKEEVSGTDSFGHVSPEGVSITLAKMIKDELGIGCRYSILSTPTRANPALISGVDSEEAFGVGQEAVKAALAGESGVMIALTPSREGKYVPGYSRVPVSEVANKVKAFPPEFLAYPNKPAKAFVSYLSPLLRGKVNVKYDSLGLIRFLSL